MDNNIKKMPFDKLFLRSIVATTTIKDNGCFQKKKCITTTADALDCAQRPKGLC